MIPPDADSPATPPIGDEDTVAHVNHPGDDAFAPSSALHVMPGIESGTSHAPRPPRRRRELSLDEYVAGIRAGDRSVIGRAITLVESSAPRHRPLARALVDTLLPHAGGAIRLGISGVPGVGKSTLIEALGTQLTAAGRRLAVLAVDPSSDLSGGSILGDKTRMERLSLDPNAYVRPSPCGRWLGGVAQGTRDAMTVCEAAGYDVVFIETVGVGQSETAVASMVDCFLLLMIGGAGDELQGIKRGIMELADVVAVTKADAHRDAATRAVAEMRSALRLMHPATPGWKVPVLACSAVSGEGLAAVWSAVKEHRAFLEASEQLDDRRRRQALRAMEHAIEAMLLERFYADESIAAALPEVRLAVLEGRLSPGAAAERLLDRGDATDESNPTE